MANVIKTNSIYTYYKIVKKEKIMKLKVPKAIVHGHANIILELNEVIAIGGDITQKAKQLRDIMTVHFKKEEIA